MASPIWQPSTQYPNGSIVQRASNPAPTPVVIPNAGFESGAVNWNFGGSIVLETGVRYQGTNSLAISGTGTTYPQMSVAAAVVAGTTINASCMYSVGSSPNWDNYGRVCLIWYTSGLVEISKSFADSYIGTGGGWKQSVITATAPATAAFVKIAGESVKTNGAHGVGFDNFAWDLTSASPSNGLEFKAVQSGTGTSAGTEPTWGVTLGSTVVDGTVTWEAITLSSVTWTASPDLVSGATEPTWVTGVGNFTLDSTGIQWEAISRIVDDPKCPQKTVAAIGASKVFVGDDDIARFSATVNPLDWTSERDAGYLPTGLQQAGANNITVIGLYRNNLVVFNANCFQMWQIDPDPESMALLDQMQGIGSIYQQAAQEVADELFFLSAQGVRTIGLSASSESLQSGDVGEPVDSLVVPSILNAISQGITPFATYYTGAGQYWLFSDIDASYNQTVWVYTQGGIGKRGTWSRYKFPFVIKYATTLGNAMYLMATVWEETEGWGEVGTFIFKLDESATTDNGVAIPAIIQWQWLDFGTTGVTKMLETVDIVGDVVAPTVSIGYDQTNPLAVTTPYQLQIDSMCGFPVPIPVSAPTFSIKLEYSAGGWELQQFNVEVRQNWKIR